MNPVQKLLGCFIVIITMFAGCVIGAGIPCGNDPQNPNTPFTHCPDWMACMRKNTPMGWCIPQWLFDESAEKTVHEETQNSDGGTIKETSFLEGEPKREECNYTCTLGEVQTCYPEGFGGCKVGGNACIGVCRPGSQYCFAKNGCPDWSPCTNPIIPKEEECNGKDDNCDGQIDEALQRICYSGPNGTRGQGLCKDGYQTCIAGQWGSCLAQTLPTKELICDGKDDDCNGIIDDGCGYFVSLGVTGLNEASSVAVDKNGDIYVTGFFSGIAPFGSIFLTSKGKKDIFIAKLNNKGAILWAISAGGSEDDRGAVIAVDTLGNVYVAGLFRDTAFFGTQALVAKGGVDLFVAKYDTTGKLLWLYSSPGDNFGFNISEMAIDTQGNCYLTGAIFEKKVFGHITLTVKGSQDIYIAKLTSNGIIESAWQIGKENSSFRFPSIVLDAKGNLYLSGSFSQTVSFGNSSITSKGVDDIFVAKLNSMGVWEWTSSAGSSSNEYVERIVMDLFGDIYITGRTFGSEMEFNQLKLPLSGNSNLFIAKLKANGSFLWAVSIKGADTEFHRTDLSIDSKGNLYLSGSFDKEVVFGKTTLSAKEKREIFVAKYDTQGALLDVKSILGIGGGWSYSTGLNEENDLYMVGKYQKQATFVSVTTYSNAEDSIFILKALR